jgi:His-Xaa-Ser system protein HxsD
LNNPENALLSAFDQIDDDTVIVHLDTGIYSRQAIFRTSCSYTDRCYIFLSASDKTGLNVIISRKNQQTDLQDLCGNFCNELIDQQLRVDIAAETADIRTLIVAQAFAEGNLLETDRDKSVDEDPRRICGNL